MSFYVIIRGPLGCGKSTISKELAKKLKAKYFSVDDLVEQVKGKDREEGYISQRRFKKANDLIVPVARELLKKGKIVIIDGNFYWKSQIVDLIEKLDFPYSVFTLKAHLEVCIERDSKRKTPHGKDAAFVVHKKVSEFDYGINIDATKPLEKSIKEILSNLPEK